MISKIEEEKKEWKKEWLQTLPSIQEKPFGDDENGAKMQKASLWEMDTREPEEAAFYPLGIPDSIKAETMDPWDRLGLPFDKDTAKLGISQLAIVPRNLRAKQ